MTPAAFSRPANRLPHFDERGSASDDAKFFKVAGRKGRVIGSAARVGVYGLTNWGSETWPLACEHFPFLGSLDGVLVSSAVGITKPDPEIFRTFCARFGVTPEESVFIDDVVQNVTAARSLGFHGIVFTDADELRNDLIRCGSLE